MRHRLLAWFLIGVCVVSLSIWYPHPSAELPPVKPQPIVKVKNQLAVDYNRDILPILSSKCFACHGPDTAARKGGFRLDQHESATKKLKSGDTPIVPGQASASEVVRRINADDPDEQMPPR